MTKKPPAPRTISDLDIGDVLRCQLGLIQLTGRLNGGFLARTYATGIGTDNRSGPFWVSPVMQVQELVERWQERYRAGGGVEVDPVRGG